MTKPADFHTAFTALPLVAILRGVTPDAVCDIATALYDAGFRVIEVPLNSPDALESIRRLAASLAPDALLGAGTVLDVDAVDAVRAAGGRLIVMPHADTRVIGAAKQQGMVCVPGAMTPTEAFAAVAAGADAVKLFPAELVTPPVLRSLRAVLPKGLRLLPVGGIQPETMATYVQAGADGFGLGSALYRPGDAAAVVDANARRFVQAWTALSAPQ